MMSLIVGDDAIDGDVFGYYYDGGRGALNWGTCKCLAVWVHAPLFFEQGRRLWGGGGA